MKYYLHDSNSFNDEKITHLFKEFGYEGLGLFYTALEKLAQQEKPIRTDVLKFQLKVGKKLEKCWSFIESIGLLSSNNGDTFNEQLLYFSEKYKIKSEKNRKKISEWREKQSLTKDVTSNETVRNAPKVKVSKVNESKVYIHTNLELDEIRGLEIDEVVKGLLIYIQTKTDQVKLLKKQLSVDEGAELIAQFTKEEIKEVLNQMDNFNGLTKKYTSVYRTMLTWLKNNKKWEKERASNKKRGSMEGFTGLIAN